MRSLKRASSGKLVVSAVAALAALAIIVGAFIWLRGQAPSQVEPGDEARPAASLETASPAGDPGDAPELAAGAPDDDGEEPKDPAETVEALGPLSLEGQVVDARGEGVPGASITALPAEAWSATVTAMTTTFERGPPDLRVLRKSLAKSFGERVPNLPRARSGPDGRFQFRGLASGSYRLSAVHPDFLPSDETWGVVGESSPATAEIRLHAAAALLGRVIAGDDGTALAGVSVRAVPDYRATANDFAALIQAVFSELDGSQLDAAPPVLTDASGHFRLRSLEPVTYTVTLTRDGYLQAVVPKVRPRSGVEAGEPMTFALQRGVSLRARVVSPDGRPVGGARWELLVRLDFDDRNPMAMAQAKIDVFGEKRREGVTDDEGRLLAPALESLPYLLEVRADAYPRLEAPVECAGEPLDLGDVRLEEARTLSGKIIDTAGKPIAGAVVELVRKEQSSPFQHGRDQVERETRSEASGSFALTPVGAEARVRASAAGYAPFAAHTVDVAATKLLEITLEPQWLLRGRVVDAGTSEPLAGVQARTYVAGGAHDDLSDEDGLFEIGGLMPGSDGKAAPAWVNLGLDGYEASGNQMVPTQGADGEPKEFPLTRMRRLEGIVLDPERTPVRGARVQFEVPGIPPFLLLMEAQNRGIPQPVVTRGDGTFSTLLPTRRGGPGKLELAVRHPRFALALISTDELSSSADKNASGEPASIEVVLTPGSRIEGRVTGPDGAALAGVQVRILRQTELTGEARMFAGLMGPTTGQITYTGVQGDYESEGLEPGHYRVEASFIGLAPASLEVDVIADATAGGTTRLDIALEDGKGLGGRVVSADGSGVAGAEIVLFEVLEDGAEQEQRGPDAAMLLFGGRGKASTRSGEDGRFTLLNLEDGVYDLVVRQRGLAPLERKGVQPGEQLGDLVLEDFGTASLRVVSAATGLPVPAFSISLQRVPRLGGPAREPNQVVRDPDGRYVEEGLVPGDYEVGIVAEGFAPHLARYSLRGGAATRDEVLALTPGERLVVRVIDAASKKPIHGAFVFAGRVYSQDEGPSASPESRLGQLGFFQQNTTDKDGVRVFDTLRAGTYRCNAIHNEYYPDSSEGAAPVQEVTLPDASGAEVVLRMRRAGQVQGKIEGLPPAGPARTFEVALYRADGGEGNATSAAAQRTWVNPDTGQFHAVSLPPGTYRAALAVREPGPRGASVDPPEQSLAGRVSVSEGTIEEASFTLPGGR